MSKSLKNFVIIRDTCEKYSDGVEFTEEHMDQIALVVKKIENFISRTQHFVKDETNKLKYTKPSKHDVKMEIEKDFDISSAIKKIMHLIDVANVNGNDYSISSLIYNYVIDITNMFSLKLENFNKQGGLFKLSKNFGIDLIDDKARK